MRICKSLSVLILLLVIMELLSCSSSKAGSQAVFDYWPTEGWRFSSPEEQGMDSEVLADMLEHINSTDISIDSIQVIRNGYVVLDSYIHPFRETDLHIIHSCTKSIVSLLTGIALDEGFLHSLDQPVLDIFKDYNPQNFKEEKKALTLRHLLTMSTGLDSRDSYLYQWEGLSGMRASGDWTGYILDLPVVAEPGTRFDYSNMASFLLSAAITESTGRNALAFGREKLFGPLGITDIQWPSDPRGNNVGWGEMMLRPLDLAKIGWLVLNDGYWENRQIIPEDYLKQATTKQIEAGTLMQNYGFQWWIKEPGLFMALGYAGQYLIVYPEKNLVVVFTSALDDQSFYAPDSLFSSFILKSLKSDTSIPENPRGRERLESLSEEMINPAALVVPDFPETARKVNGRIYVLEENPYGMTALSFSFVEGEAQIHEYYNDKMIAFYIGLDGRYLINEVEGVAVTGKWEDDRSFRTIFAGQGSAWFVDQLTVFEEDSLRLDLRNNGGDLIHVRGVLRNSE